MVDQNTSPENRNSASKLTILLRRWPISRRLLTSSLLSIISLVFVIIIFGVNASIVYSSFDKLINDTASEIRTFNFLNVATHMLLSETREYAFLQEPDTLEEIEETFLEINNALFNLERAGENLEDETEVNEEAENLDSFKTAIFDMEAQVNQIISYVQAGADEKTIEEAVEVLENTEQDIEVLLEEIEADLQAEFTGITSKILNQIQVTLTIVGIGMAIFLVVNLGLSHFTASSIITPIENLVETSLQIAEGDTTVKADDDGQDEISTLANAYNRMNTRQRDLLLEVENTALDLQHTLDQLTASSQVSRAVASVLDPDELVTTVVTLIQQSFGLYYVGIFIVDERNEWAVLRAGTGTAGQIMLDRQHRIKVGQGMIGWSIANAQARVALDVGDDKVRLATSELPETRSELAIPIRSRNSVLGAFTIQDSKANAFDDQAITIFQQMADQVATALENARLYTESQTALEASRQAYSDVSQVAWNQYLESQSDIDFLATPQTETKISENAWHPEMAETFQVGDITRHGDRAVHIPIILRNQTLGVVRLRKRDEAGPWSAQEIELMNTLVDQLETALETARLYSDTQRQAARVSLTQNVTDKLHRSLDMDNLMETLLQEISTALGATSGFVQLRTPTPESDSAGNL